jgi:regulator of protease activity HflC (stomatin/prohibitin superfamily)
MKKLILSLALSILGGCYTITPGRVTVQAYVCGTMPESDRYTIIRGGRVGLGPCVENYSIPIREQRAVWSQTPDDGSTTDESITFAGVDGQPVNVDIGIAYLIEDSDEAIIKMIRTYGPSLEVTIDSKVRDYVRDSMNSCASTLRVEDIYGAKKSELMACAEKRVQDEFSPNGLVVTRLTLNSEVRLPERIRDAMQQAQAASQDADKVRREVEKTKAEGEKIVEQARAEAEALRLRAESEALANELISKSLTPQVLEMRRLEVEQERISKWNGQLPTTVMGSQVPMMVLEK